MSATGSRWAGKVALVTGASSGIGEAVAIHMAQAGIKVALAARRKERITALAERLQQYAPTMAIQVDLRDPEQIDGMFSQLRESWGGVDILVNNAGLGRKAPLMSGETEHWREMLDVNVLALCICTREAIKDMRTRGDNGHVLHISSMASHRVPGGSGVYAASKYAVRALTEGLRQELRQAHSQIRISAISPGFVETEFAEVYHGDPEAAKDTYSRYKVLESNDIAQSVMFVLESPPHMQVHDVLIRPTEQPS